MELMFCETQQLHKVENSVDYSYGQVIGCLAQCPTLRHIVVFSTSYLHVNDAMTEATVSACNSYGVKIYSMDQVIAMV